MTTNNQTTSPVSSSRQRARRLRVTGIIILALGILSAGLVYWIGSRNEDLGNDPSMLRFNAAEQQQMGRLYGDSGEMIDDWTNDLKQPGTQAVLILIVSGVAAAGCFYFARLFEIEEDPPAPSA